MRALRFKDQKSLIHAMTEMVNHRILDGFCVKDVFGRPVVTPKLEGEFIVPEVFTVSAAPWVARWSQSGLKLMAFLLPCETAALLELAKLKQANLENLLLVSIICEGFSDENGGKRSACMVCRRRVADWTDFHLHLDGGEVVLSAMGERGEELLKVLGGADTEWQPPRRQDHNRFTAFVAEKRAEMRGWSGLRHLFEKCVLCLNCMRVCPVCVCPHCYFESKEAAGSGQIWRERIKADTADFTKEVLWFHLGRAYHIALLCVGCGLCGDACPRDVDVFGFFAVVSSAAQERFRYDPGKNPDEPLPLTVFKKEEFEDVG